MANAGNALNNSNQDSIFPKTPLLMGPALPLNITEQTLLTLSCGFYSGNRQTYFTISPWLMSLFVPMLCSVALVSFLILLKIHLASFHLTCFFYLGRVSQITAYVPSPTQHSCFVVTLASVVIVGGIYSSDWLAFWIDLAMSCVIGMSTHTIKKSLTFNCHKKSTQHVSGTPS